MFFFPRYGFKVGQYPWYFTFGCLIFCGLSALGLLNYTEENNAFRLWIPTDSAFVTNYEWLLQNYPPNVRYNNIILSGEDVLKPDALKLLMEIHKEVQENITAQPFDKRWQDVCKK